MTFGGNNGGRFVLPEGLHDTVRAAGMSFVNPNAVAWNAPAPDARQREREERQEAQKVIEKSLGTVRAALANPNLSDAQRSELVQQQTQLEGLQTQLATGARSVDVAQVSAIATQVSSNVSATVASVSAGGMSGGTVGAMQIQSSQQMVQLQQNLYQNDSIYRAQTDRVMGEAAEGRRQVDALGRTTQSLERRLGIDTTESDRRLADIRKQRDAATDPLGKLRGDAAEAGEIDRRAQEALAEAKRQGTGVAEAEENARKTADAKRLADERLRKQQQNTEQAIGRDQSLTPEQRERSLREVRQGNSEQRAETRAIGKAEVTQAAADIREDTARFAQREADTRLLQLQRVTEQAISQNPNLTPEQRAERLREVRQVNVQRDDRIQPTAARGALGNDVATVHRDARSRTVLAESRQNFTVGERDEDEISSTSKTDVVSLQSTPTVQQVASTEQAREAAKPLAENKSEATEAKPENTQTPRTQVAAAQGQQTSGRTTA